jgi:hypothetical protein
VRKKLNAEGARSYFRQVDAAANAYFEPWALGESRFIANANSRLTMQHRRAYQAPHTGGVANGHLVKRWTNEELLLPGQVVDQAVIAALCSEEDTAPSDEQAGALCALAGNFKTSHAPTSAKPTSPTPAPTPSL